MCCATLYMSQESSLLYIQIQYTELSIRVKQSAYLPVVVCGVIGLMLTQGDKHQGSWEVEFLLDYVFAVFHIFKIASLGAQAVGL
jgi:type IV secretory pathway VirB2 component (pilin)